MALLEVEFLLCLVEFLFEAVSDGFEVAGFGFEFHLEVLVEGGEVFVFFDEVGDFVVRLIELLLVVVFLGVELVVDGFGVLDFVVVVGELVLEGLVLDLEGVDSVLEVLDLDVGELDLCEELGGLEDVILEAARAEERLVLARGRDGGVVDGGGVLEDLRLGLGRAGLGLGGHADINYY